MRNPITFLRRLHGDCSGLAMIEFAMSLPILMALSTTGLEVANLVRADMRVSEIGMRTADNAARVRDSITDADVKELMIGAKLIGEPIDFGENGRVILSSIEQNAAKNGQWIRWQRCYGKKTFTSAYGAADKGKSDTSLQAVGPAGNQIAAMAGTAIMFVEVSYDYQPLISDKILGKKTLSYVGAYNVRQRTDQVIKDGGLTDANKMLCSKYTA